jgi:hypothetical protein
MPQEPTAIEQAVSRAIRDNLERIQRTTDELNQAVNDVVAACASTKPGNALPPMLRAQSTAASLAAAMEVLSRFVAVTLQPQRSPLEAEMARLSATITTEAPSVAAAAETPKPAQEAVTQSKVSEVPVAEHKLAEAVEAKKPESSAHEATTPVNAAASHPVVAEPPVAPSVQPKPPSSAVEAPSAGRKKTDIHGTHKAETVKSEPEPLDLPKSAPFPPDSEVAGETDFDVNQLSAEERELHRRANRVAKVSMQDIKMLRPEQVRLGREKKDLCIRLRDDIEKAHREYDRRFRPIMDHPVDYFYRWMVEILADGDAHALGEYPYAVHANQR